MTTNSDQSVFQPLPGSSFRFACHKDLACFTKCCARLQLILTPYDIVRLKTRLKIDSDQFLDQYTDIKMDSHPRFPMVRLLMSQDKDKKCPFVTSDGCTVYEGRPGACRIYPLGRAALKIEKQFETKETFFVVKEGHCLGFQETREWTIEEWLSNEGLEEYNRMNDLWLEILHSPKSLGTEPNLTRKIQMFYMASYNLDRFRNFIFKSPFFERFDVDPEEKELISADDVALMKFAFNWLKFSLFEEKTMRVTKI